MSLPESQEPSQQSITLQPPPSHTTAEAAAGQRSPAGRTGAINKESERCRKGAALLQELEWFILLLRRAGTAGSDVTDAPLQQIMLENGTWKRTETLGAVGRLATLGGAGKLAEEKHELLGTLRTHSFQTSRAGGKQQKENSHGIFSVMKILYFWMFSVYKAIRNRFFFFYYLPGESRRVRINAHFRQPSEERAQWKETPGLE